MFYQEYSPINIQSQQAGADYEQHNTEQIEPLLLAELSQTAIPETQHSTEPAEQSLLDEIHYALRQRKKARFEEKLHILVSTIFYLAIDTSVGKFYVAYQGHSICFCSFENEKTFLQQAERFLGRRPQSPVGFPQPEGLAESIHNALEKPEEYKGPLVFKELPTSHQALLRLIQHIPPLQTRSYSEIYRTLAAADIHLSLLEIETCINQNPFTGIIPCHRVIYADHRLGNYAGGSPHIKKQLLLREGVFVDEKNRVRPHIQNTEREKVLPAPPQQTRVGTVPMSPSTSPTIPLRQVAIRYLDWIIQRYDHIRIKGEVVGNDQIKLDEIYTPMRIRLYQPSPLAQEEHGTYPETDLTGTMLLPSNFSLIQQWLQRRGPILLTGDIGSGKSMLLRYLALQLAHLLRERVKTNKCDIEQDHCWLPVPIQLKDYVQHGLPLGKPLNDFLVSYFVHHQCPCPAEGLAYLLETQFIKGGCVVMLNGLHEITNELQRKQLMKEISEFIAHDSPPGNRFIITGKPEEDDIYFNQSLPKPFVFYTVESMNAREIRCFFERWFAAVGVHSTYLGSVGKGETTTTINKLCKLARIWQSNQRLAITPLHLQTLITTYTIVNQQHKRRDPEDELILLLSKTIYLQQRAIPMPPLARHGQPGPAKATLELLPPGADASYVSRSSHATTLSSTNQRRTETNSNSASLRTEARKLLPVIQQRASAFIWPGKNIMSEISFTC